MRSVNFRTCSLVFIFLLLLQISACGGGSNSGSPYIEWPIANEVFTTAEQQILPVPVPVNAPLIKPKDIAQYAEYGYSAWLKGPGLPYVKRSELAPGHKDATNAARLLSFFAMTDIHLTDKESPAQMIDMAWDPNIGGSTSGWTPVINSTTQVLDAAVQTINALHEKSKFDFGISLGDNINNTQYNELRWFIDVLDGQNITPSSGDHRGADTVDYQMPYKAAGLNKEIPWYQAIGNHDQYFSGWAPHNEKLFEGHIGDTIINFFPYSPDWPVVINGTGAYMGVVDGLSPYGYVYGAGPETDYPTPPTVAPDYDRRSLVTPESTSLNWMKEFFNTTSKPVGHGFSQANLDKDFASYSFEPKSDLPLKVIVLDDTCKGIQSNYAAGCLDRNREDWLLAELNEGQQSGKLMIIAAHIPLLPQTSNTDPTITSLSHLDDKKLLAALHDYPNLLLWISGHRHMNVVTPQPTNPANLNDRPEGSFWEVETASLRDNPQQFRTFDIRRNSDNTVSIIVTDVDPAVVDSSPAATSRGYAIAQRVFSPTPESLADTSSRAYNAELVKLLTPEMQAKIAKLGTPIN